MAQLIGRKNVKGVKIWYVRYFYKRKITEKSTGTSNKRLAERIKSKVENDLRFRKFGIHETADMPLSELFTRRLQYLTDQNRSTRTIAREELVFRVFRAFLGSDPIETPDQEVFESYKRSRRAAGISPTGVNIEIRHLQAAFNWGAAQGYCHKVKIQQLKVHEKLPTFLDESEVKRFLAVIDDPYWRLMFEMFLFTGGRLGEVINLKWGDIDLGRKVVRFRKTKSAQEREIPIHPALMERLDGLGGTPEERLFHHSSSWVYRNCREFAERAGITQPEKKKVHALRHTFASALVMKGVDLPTVSKLLGHSSIVVTISNYAHLTPGHMKNAVKKLSWVS